MTMSSPRARSMSVTATPTTLNTSGLASATLFAGLRVSRQSITVPTQLSSARVSCTAGLVAPHPLIITE